MNIVLYKRMGMLYNKIVRGLSITLENIHLTHCESSDM